jgi:hypothetical protein
MRNRLATDCWLLPANVKNNTVIITKLASGK